MVINCECDNPDCVDTIELSLDEIFWLRQGDGARLIMVPGHEDDTDEVITTDSEGKFVVVISDL